MSNRNTSPNKSANPKSNQSPLILFSVGTLLGILSSFIFSNIPSFFSPAFVILNDTKISLEDLNATLARLQADSNELHRIRRLNDKTPSLSVALIFMFLNVHLYRRSAWTRLGAKYMVLFHHKLLE